VTCRAAEIAVRRVKQAAKHNAALAEYDRRAALLSPEPLKFRLAHLSLTHPLNVD
jgi:hypothetical protein